MWIPVFQSVRAYSEWQGHSYQATSVSRVYKKQQMGLSELSSY